MIETIIILFLVLLNGFFAMSEIAIVSSKKARLEDFAKKGKKGAGIALNLMIEPEKFLSTVQVGITLIGIVAGAYGGIAISEDITPVLQKIDFIKDAADEIAIILVVSAITYLSLVVGELVPKTIAFNNPEAIAVAVAPAMKVLSVIVSPVIWFLSISTKLFLKLFRIKQNVQPPVTEEELKILLEQGSKYGTVETREADMIRSIFRFGDRNAESIMTIRKDIVWINVNDSPEKIRDFIIKYKFSKYPVCDGSLDKLLGIMSIRDFLENYFTIDDVNLRSILIQPVIVTEFTSSLKILDKFRETKNYTAIVIDEYGDVKGMITLHDLVENIFGDLPEFFEKSEEEIYYEKDGSMLIDGSYLVDELEEKLNIELEEKDKYNTLGGFVMYYLNRIPATGDNFEKFNYLFKVIDMDGKRVDKVMVKKIS
ncbi:MAG TPA: hemolysin family protein [Melioribacteraceae bacterium]|nr:hemolysin family protein [Melioribacteraceae bacterium]